MTRQSLFRKYTRFFMAALLLLSLQPFRAAAAPESPTITPTFLSDIDRNHYPYAHAVLAADIEHLDFDADGSRSGSDDVYITILDDEGKRDQEVLSFYVNRAYSRIRLELVEIIHNGRRRVVDIAANSREEAAAGNSRANIYNPLERVIKVFLPGLNVGDTIHYRVHRRQFQAIIAKQIYGSILAQYDIPIHSYLYTVTVPEKLEPRWLIKNKIPECVHFRRVRLPGSQPRILLSWHFRKVPMIVPEPDMPSFKRVAMRLSFSTLPDWQAIADWYDQLVEPRLEPQPELLAKVAELTAGQPDEKSRIAALFYFVARKIRYLGVNGESLRPGFEPHDINLTYSRRHGVCRDKAALLAGMLRAAGIEAAPVLIQVGDRLDPEIPLPWFNHAIVAVLDHRHKARLFLDPTSETSRQFLPDYERECSCLVATPQASTLELTPPQPPRDNLLRIEISDQLTADGHFSGTIKVTCRGFNDTVMRSILMNSGTERRRRIIRRFFMGQASRLELSHIKYSDPADTGQPFSFSGHFNSSARPLPQSSGAFLLVPPAFMEDPGLLDRWILAKAGMTRRRYPLKLGYTYTTEIEERLSFPPDFEITLPADTKINTPVLEAGLQFSRQPDGVLIRRFQTIKKTEISPDEYPSLTRLQERNLKLSRNPLTFRPQRKTARQQEATR